MWAAQQRHLECIQDPPGVDLPYYKGLEGFHVVLPFVIPGPHCAARPYQVYLISGIARWDSDRRSDAVFGGRGRRPRTYSAPLINRLNTRCQELFDEPEDQNFLHPADVRSDELLGLENPFRQGAFSLQDTDQDGPEPDEEVLQPGQPEQEETDEAYHSDAEDGALDADLPHIALTNDETATVHHPAFDDVCSANPLPGFQQLERFCSVLVDVGLTENKLSVTTEERDDILKAWNAVEEHDKQPQPFTQLYRSHWGSS
ncbi:putative LOC107381940-like protein [Nothobranchius furzeri]|uniref:LOC107381940-like protein n=2 Tax=Nothobranchius furzeri TaxID=105023 RepID=A0A9D2XAB4_NOTFU|nr:putative LOC107381940-like protein [Nothobranchius furzeri]